MKYHIKSFILIVIILVISTHVLAKEEIDIEKELEKVEKALKIRNENPILLRIKLNHYEIESWKGLSGRLEIFREICKKLYDPTATPFNITTSTSSTPESFTATTQLGSVVGDYKIHVLQIAKSDKIASKPFKKGEKKLNGSVFTIQSGKEKLKIDFSKGGTLNDLYKKITDQKQNIIKAYLTQVDDENEMLVIEGARTGDKYKLAFLGSRQFFMDIGFVQPPKVKSDDFYNLQNIKKDVIDGNYSIEKNILTMDTESKLMIQLPKSLKVTPSMILEMEIMTADKKIDTSVKPKTLKRKDLGTIDKVEVDRIKIYTDPLIDDIDSNKKKNLSAKSNPSKIQHQFIQPISINDKGLKQYNLLNLKSQWTKIRIELGKLLPKSPLVSKLLFANPIINKIYSIKNIKIYDPLADKLRKDYNYMDQAQDAKFLFNKITITRDKNEVSDLLRGVTLKLLSSSQNPGILKITREMDKIVEELQKFVDEYNNVMLYIKNVTTYSPRKNLEQLDAEEERFSRKSYEERKYAELSGELYKGVLSSDFSVRSLKVKLRQGMVYTPYESSIKKDIKFLFQIGIRDPDKVGEQINNENFKAGYLFLDKKKLRNKLETHFKQIKELFAYSIGKSFVKERGIAVDLVKLIDGYAKRSTRDKQGKAQQGIIEVKKQSLDRQKKFLDSRLTWAKRRTKWQLDSQKRKYQRMVAAQKKAKQMRDRLNNTFGSMDKK